MALLGTVVKSVGDLELDLVGSVHIGDVGELDWVWLGRFFDVDATFFIMTGNVVGQCNTVYDGGG